MTYIISVANEKGGVAKTTTSISLGAALVETGARVLLLDMDGQGNLSLALGSDPSKVTESIAKSFIEGAPIKQLIRTTEVPNLDLVPSNKQISLLERSIPSRPEHEKILQRNLVNEQLPYDFLILDNPPFLGAVTVNALTASNLLIIPTQPEFFSIYALRALMNTVRKVRSEANPILTYRLLLTMFDRRNRIHRDLSGQLHANFENGLFRTIIEVDTKLRESSIAGLPITNHAPKSRSAFQYRALAQEIQEYVKETTSQPAG